SVHRSHIGEGLFRGVALVRIGGNNKHAAAQHLANFARACRIVYRPIDADLDLVGSYACCLFLFGIAQVALVIAATDDAEQRHAAALFLPSSACTGFPVARPVRSCRAISIAALAP